VDLAAAAQPEDEVERRLLLDVVVAEGPAVLELLAREDEALLVGGDALLVLDLLLDVVDRVRRLDVERDGLPRERLDEDLQSRGRKNQRTTRVYISRAPSLAPLLAPLAPPQRCPARRNVTGRTAPRIKNAQRRRLREPLLSLPLYVPVYISRRRRGPAYLLRVRSF